MADQIQTSFIPKRAKERRRGRPALSWLSLVASLVFVLSLASAAGVFLYKKFLEGSIVRKEASLERARQEFEPELIQELARLDERMIAARERMEEHRAFSNTFRLLEDDTLQTVRFSKLVYTETPEGHLLSMSGEAASFGSVALQADRLNKNPALYDIIFSNLSLNERGAINFDVTASIDPSLFAYVPPQSVLPPPGIDAGDGDGTTDITDTAENEATTSPEDTDIP